MCPECDASVSVLRAVERGEVIQCGECGAELEVVALAPMRFVLAPPEEEDWGE
ncbi:MAG: lysine biosynthesis protein LysW [Chloroflexi bacterium]|nr:MAG: lysine biosynthesis protein LysW [Chloroflexota bacterium]